MACLGGWEGREGGREGGCEKICDSAPEFGAVAKLEVDAAGEGEEEVEGGMPV